MRTYRRLLLILCVGLTATVAGQAVEVGLANDHFYPLGNTDRYFTSGAFLSLISAPRMDTTGFRLLGGPAPRTQRIRYTLRHRIFTPDSIYTPNFQLDDRPYTATLTLARYRMVDFPAAGLSLVHGWEVGVLGKLALGEPVQNGYHRLVDFADEVLGWRHQLRGDLIVNYTGSLAWVRGIGPRLTATGALRLRVGTLFDDLEPRLSLRYRLISGRRVTYTLEGAVAARGVAYDATLTGGLINVDRRYRGHLRPERLRRSLLLASYCRVGRLTAGSGVTATNRSFVGGEGHAWGWLLLRWN